jgi:hypothetical protein
MYYSFKIDNMVILQLINSIQISDRFGTVHRT